MKRCRIIILLLFLTISIPAANAQETSCIPADGTPIRIGAIFPAGSLITVRSSEPYQGAEAMRNAVNACGGVNGHPVEFVYIPTRDRQDAENAAHSLIEEEQVSLIIGSGSAGAAEILKEIAEDSHIVYWEVSEAFTGGEWSFTPRPNNYQLGEYAARFIESTLMEQLGLSEVRTAFIHEARPLSEQIAAGVLDTLSTAPLIEQSYENSLNNTYDLALQMRENKINVVILGAFDDDADRLWYALRQADANIAAWIHIGGSGYLQNLCSRFGNTDGLISISSTGNINREYRHDILGALYTTYRREYIRANRQESSNAADLSASGVYMLLTQVLPNVEGDYTPENIRTAIINTEINHSTGLMGEGLHFDLTTGQNVFPGVIIQQQQYGELCTSYPSNVATCGVPLQSFPTWRERAIISETQICSDSA